MTNTTKEPTTADSADIAILINNLRMMSEDKWDRGESTEEEAIRVIEILQARLAEAEEEKMLCRSAIESASDFINDLELNKYELETDSGQSCVRVVLRELNEAIGIAAPMLLMERREGQKLYALNYKELKKDLTEAKETNSDLSHLAASHLSQLRKTEATIKAIYAACHIPHVDGDRDLLARTIKAIIKEHNHD